MSKIKSFALLAVLILIFPMINAEKEEKIKVECFGINGVKEKKISYEEAKYIVDKIKYLQRRGSEEVLNEIIDYLSFKNIVRIPKISVLYKGGNETNLFCYIYGGAVVLLTFLPRNLPIIVLSSLFPPLLTIASLTTAFLPKFLIPACFFLGVFGL